MMIRKIDLKGYNLFININLYQAQKSCIFVSEKKEGKEAVASFCF